MGGGGPRNHKDDTDSIEPLWTLARPESCQDQEGGRILIRCSCDAMHLEPFFPSPRNRKDFQQSPALIIASTHRLITSCRCAVVCIAQIRGCITPVMQCMFNLFPRLRKRKDFEKDPAPPLNQCLHYVNSRIRCSCDNLWQCNVSSTWRIPDSRHYLSPHNEDRLPFFDLCTLSVLDIPLTAFRTAQ